MIPIQYRAFLSHQEEDSAFAEALAVNLRSNGVEVFFDRWDIGSIPIPEETEEALSACNLFLYVLSPTSANSKWGHPVYHTSLYRKINNHTQRIIPVLLKKCDLPPFVAPLEYIDFQGSNIADPSSFSAEQQGPFKELLETIFQVPKKAPPLPVHPAFASYELYYQPFQGDSMGVDIVTRYEIGFKNITDSPLQNFTFTLDFREPVSSIQYDASRSSANMTGGDGLTDGGKRFNWSGNRIAEDGGWAVFIVKAKTTPVIENISTNLVGRIGGTDNVIAPDPNVT